MKGKIFNEKQKEDLRIYFEELLISVPENTKVSINPVVLRQLIFNIKYDMENHRIIRYPIWTGEFLRKIDLSKISFENVDWNLSNLDEKYKDKKIDLSFTNANIDFSKTLKELINCNFSHIDLSKSNCISIINAKKCDFSYSGALFDFNTENIENKRIYFSNCNFEGLNLTDSYIDAYYILDHEYPDDFGLIKCNFSNTGLTIVMNDKPTHFYDCLLKGSLNGCYYYERDYDEEKIFEKKKILI